MDRAEFSARFGWSAEKCSKVAQRARARPRRRVRPGRALPWTARRPECLRRPGRERRAGQPGAPPSVQLPGMCAHRARTRAGRARRGLDPPAAPDARCRGRTSLRGARPDARAPAAVLGRRRGRGSDQGGGGRSRRGRWRHERGHRRRIAPGRRRNQVRRCGALCRGSVRRLRRVRPDRALRRPAAARASRRRHLGCTEEIVQVASAALIRSRTRSGPDRSHRPTAVHHVLGIAQPPRARVARVVCGAGQQRVQLRGWLGIGGLVVFDAFVVCLGARGKRRNDVLARKVTRVWLVQHTVVHTADVEVRAGLRVRIAAECSRVAMWPRPAGRRPRLRSSGHPVAGGRRRGTCAPVDWLACACVHCDPSPSGVAKRPRRPSVSAAEGLDEVRGLAIADQSRDVGDGEWLVRQEFGGVAQSHRA
jgi:hypothetical protein